MALYECIFITRADLSKQDVSTVTEEFAAIVKDAGGKIVKEEYWGLRTLAYKINKSAKGHYFMLGADAPAEAIAEITRQAGINENIVRNMNVRVDEIKDEASPILRKDDDDRPRRHHNRAA